MGDITASVKPKLAFTVNSIIAGKLAESAQRDIAVRADGSAINKIALAPQLSVTTAVNCARVGNMAGRQGYP